MFRSSAFLSGLAAVIAFVLAAALINHGLIDSSLPVGPGLTLDESFNIDQGVYLVDALEQHGPLLFTPTVAREVFGIPRYLPDHPPVGRVVLGIAHQMTSWLIPGSESTAYNVPAARLGSCFALAITVLLMTEFARRRYGNATAVCAAIMLTGMPNVMGHARIASLESVTNLAWVAAMIPLLSWWTKPAPPTARHAIISGVLWGLLLLTKVQAIFLPVIVFLWSIWQFRWQAIRPLAIFGATGAIVFFAGWPWLWLDPVNHVLQYLGRTTDRQTLYCWYFGQRYADKAVPWHFPVVMTLFTLPAWTIIGLLIRSVKSRFDSVEQLLGLLVLFPIAVFAVPSVPVYDGTRLFLIIMPPIALLAARGFALTLFRQRSEGLNPQVASQQVTSGPRRLGQLIVWVLLIVAPLPWIMQPLAISQYGPLAGGNRGAAWLGMEASYWSDALNSDFWKQIPEDSVIFVAPVSHQFQLSGLETLVPVVQQRRLQLRAWDYSTDQKAGLLLLIHRLADLRPELAELPPDTTVITEVQHSGVVYAQVIDTFPESQLQRN
jgi:hypothetical protein